MSCQFKDFGVFLECASNAVPNITTLQEFIDVISAMGYNRLYLGTADTYEIESEPDFGYMRGRFTKEEIKSVDTYARQKGVKLIPAIQVLGHLSFMGKYESYADIIDMFSVLLVDDEKVNRLVDKMFATMADMYSSREIHIGMDETYGIGLGRYLEKHGYKPRLDIMLKHLNTVLGIAQKYGFTCEMWSDMFFRLFNSGSYDDVNCEIPEEVKSKYPQNVKLIYWNYRKMKSGDFDIMINRHKRITDNIAFAGGIMKWYGFAPNNTYSIEMGKTHIDGCVKHGIESFIVTLWGDGGSEASIFSVLPGLYFYSQYAGGKATGLEDLDKDGFKALTGVDFDDYVLLDLLNNPHDKAVEYNCKNLFYLYGDVLFGDYDSLISEGLGDAYSRVENRLRQVKGARFQYIFDNLADLAGVLSIKSEMSKTIRSAYLSKDYKTLKSNCLAINSCVERLDNFFVSTKVRWYKENKAFGFEVLCQRIGGLRQRMIFVKTLLEDYLSGKIAHIEELEAEQQPFNLAASKKPVTEDNYANITWSLMVTHGFI